MQTSAFRCPACNASLETGATGEATVRCEYCRTTVIVPEALRAGQLKDAGDELAAIGALLAEGRKIEAIKHYRDLRGAGLKEAKAAVEALQRGEAVALDPATTATAPRARGCSPLGVVILLLLVGGGLYLAWKLLGEGNRPNLPAGLPGGGPAAEVLASGEGNGPGYFQDSRTLAVDNEGQLYVGDFDGGRVQRLAADGTPLGQWFTAGKGILQGLVAGPDGTLYVLERGQINLYERESGRLLGPLSERLSADAAAVVAGARFEALAPSGDGGLAAVGDGLLLRLNAQGEPALLAPDLFAALPADVANRSVAAVALDGANNVYLLFTFEDPVYRFDAEGRYVDRFGRAGEGPGEFISPTALATDGRGRLLVDDFGRVLIFDGSGTHEETLAPGGVSFALHVQDGYLYRLDRNGNRLVRYALREQAAE